MWFTKGLGCPFCRHLMSQLARIADRIHGLDTEVLQVTPTPPDRGQRYARKITLPFPYLCDPQRVAAQAWGLTSRGHSARSYLRRPPAPMSRPAWRVTPLPGEFLEIITDEDVGFFIVDRGGDVRYAHSGSIYARGAQLPDNDDLLARLAALNTDA